MINASGGKYSEQLTRACTHLLADKPKGRKYVIAQTWGIHVVTTNWLFDSINLKGCADVSKYEVSAMGPDYDDIVYTKSGSGSRLGSHYHGSVHSPVARRNVVSPYSTPLLVRRNRYSGSSSVPTVYPPPFPSSSLPSPSPATAPPSRLSSSVYAPPQILSRSTPTSSSSNNNNARTILSYFDKSKFDQMMSGEQQLGITYGKYL